MLASGSGRCKTVSEAQRWIKLEDKHTQLSFACHPTPFVANKTCLQHIKFAEGF